MSPPPNLPRPPLSLLPLLNRLRLLNPLRRPNRLRPVNPRLAILLLPLNLLRPPVRGLRTTPGRRPGLLLREETRLLEVGEAV